MEKDVLNDQFNISYSESDYEMKSDDYDMSSSTPVEGYLKLKFDYRDNFLPRSIISSSIQMMELYGISLVQTIQMV